MLRGALAVILAALFLAMPGFVELAQAQYNPWKEIKAVPPARPAEVPAPFLRG